MVPSVLAQSAAIVPYRSKVVAACAGAASQSEGGGGARIVVSAVDVICGAFRRAREQVYQDVCKRAQITSTAESR